MREITHDGMRWEVREAAAAHVPGARGERCLIFEGDGVVRRVWEYPRDWITLSDEAICALAERRATPRPRITEVAVEIVATPEPVFESANRVATQTRSLFAQVVQLREARANIEGAHLELVDQWRLVRREMRDAVQAYAEAMRRAGVPPERALVLLKSAMQEGLTGVSRDEPSAEELVQDGVGWCITAYYAE